MWIRTKFVVAAAGLGIVAAVLVPTSAAQASTSFTVPDCEGALNGRVFSVPTGTRTMGISFITSCSAKTPPAPPPFPPTAPQNPPNFGIASSASVNWYDNEIRVTNTIWVRINYTGNPGPISISVGNTNSSLPIVNGTYTVYFASFPASTTPFAPGSFTIVVGGGGGGGGGGGASSSSSAPAPQTFELAFTPSDGTVCTRSSESGTGGTWISLPGASDCTPPATKPNAKLLGWATSPTFPVSIAKRQVDNGWGAYETFNADGQLTGVFIPAGGATFLSAAGNIYPIWNQ